MIWFTFSIVFLSLECVDSAEVLQKPEVLLKSSNNLLRTDESASIVTHRRTLRRAAFRSGDDKRTRIIFKDDTLTMKKYGGESVAGVTSRKDRERTLVETLSLFLAAFVCVSGVALSLCAVCDSCRGKEEKVKKLQNGYIGRMDLADIKVIYNPAAEGAFHLPVYAHSTGGAGASENTGVKTAGFNNQGFTESRENLVLGNTSTLTSVTGRRSARAASSKAGTYKIRNTNSSAALRTGQSDISSSSSAFRAGQSESSTVPRTRVPSTSSAYQSHADGTTTYDRPPSRRKKINNTYDVERSDFPGTYASTGGASTFSGTVDGAKNGGKLKDIHVDRGNRIVLTYENGPALNDDRRRTDETNNTGRRTDPDTGTGKGKGKRKGASRDIEDIANSGGTGLNYDMNDVAIKNMYTKY